MAQQIIVNVDDPDDLITGYGAGAKVRIERATSSAFADATEIAALTLVSGQTQYEYWDAAGLDTSWYRSRYSATGGAPFSGYSDGFQIGAPRTYATLDALREYIKLPDDRDDNLLTDLLRQATDYLTTKMRRDVFRHPPISGTETRLFNGAGSSELAIPVGLIPGSVTTIRVAGGTGGDFTALVAADWAIPETSPYVGVGGTIETRPASYLDLTDIAGVDSWYKGFATAEITAAFGFPAIPSMVEKATLDLAREWYRQGPGGGGPVGVNQYGTPLFAAGMPKTVADAIAEFGRASWVVN